MKGNKLIDDRVQILVNLVRYKSHGKIFEIAINPDKAVAFLEGDSVDIEEIVESEHIFVDMKKGLFASKQDLESVFQTTSISKIVPIMLREGEIQFNQKYREQLRERKYNNIVHLIHKTAIDPKTKLPHPINRIESAIKEAKIKIDNFKKPKDQVNDIIKKLQLILPLSCEKAQLECIVPAQFASQARHAMQSQGTISKENWINDGSIMFELVCPAGKKTDAISTLQAIAKGQATIKEK
ncbi:MAG: ribosome assembly factor SBDS [Candidatus Woesearchaeota archaeon]